nr:MAG TPA: hypothetical protein [Caudoviricetes sp.]
MLSRYEPHEGHFPIIGAPHSVQNFCISTVLDGERLFVLLLVPYSWLCAQLGALQ